MKASSRCGKKNERTGQSDAARARFLPALVALGGGCGLIAASASALELGDIRIHSALGQPLRASVAYALQPNEQIHDYCIYLRPGTAASGLPLIGNATIAAGNGTIRITGRTAIREPLVSLQLTVDCPNSAHLRREYAVFVDPMTPSREEATVLSASATLREPAAVEPAQPSRSTAERRAEGTAAPAGLRTVAGGAARAPVPSSGSYRVQPGDSLSLIASRVPGRTVAIWPAADAIFAANPDAFIDNDRNLLRAGALLAIPDAIVARESIAAARPVAEADSPGAASAVEAPVVATPQPSAAETNRVAETALPATAAVSGSGDVTRNADSPFVSPALEESVSTRAATPADANPETAVANPAAAGTVPAVRGSDDTAGAGGMSWTWLAWLGGSGVALILALLLFGRKLKDRFAPAASADAFARRRTDSGNLDDTDVSPVLGLPAQGRAAVARMVSLDADLEDGSGLQYGGDIDVAQDFGFDGSGTSGNGLDIDLSDADPHGSTTDIIAPRQVGEATILVSETPPQHDDVSGEYDVSMIVDATRKLLDDAEGTTKDLRVIEVEAAEDEPVSEYTLSHDIDYKILEQDYEDELTATQALNAEIARAAQALSRQFGKDEMGDTLTDTMNDAVDDNSFQQDVFGSAESGDDETTALPVPEAFHGVDDTAQMSLRSTVNLDDTANEEIAVGLPAAENDSTVEVDIESATIDTRKIRAS